MALYDLPEPADVDLAVYDALGRRVATLAAGPEGPGRKRASLDGLDLPAGLYVVRLRAGPFAQTRTVTVVR